MSLENHQIREPEYARANLERGEFSIAYFQGQTFLFIPLPIYQKLGEIKIMRLADQVFGKNELAAFKGSTTELELSFFIELPPQFDYQRNPVIDLMEALKALL